MIVSAVLVTAFVVGSPAGGAWAGPATASGASAYWNPAALAQLQGTGGGLIELTGLLVRVAYQREAEDPSREPEYPEASFLSAAPDLFASFAAPTPWSSLSLIGGSFSPTAGGTRWPEDGPQRYHATDALALTYGFTAGLLWRLGDRFSLAVAGGPLYARVELASAYDFAGFINSKLPPGADLFALEDPAMEGKLELAATGWTHVVTLGALAKLTDALTLGAGLITAGAPTLVGTMNLTGPPAFAEALPDYVISPEGRLELAYPLPWIAHGELELVAGRVTYAAMFQYARRSVQRVLRAWVDEATAGYVEGAQVSIKETRDKWTAGVRADLALAEPWRIAARVDLSPRNIPKEALSPVNLDLTLVEGSLGVRYRASAAWTLDATYGVGVGVPVDVERSIFNPRADPASGLAAPSARGRYSALAHKLVLGAVMSFGGS